MLGLKSPRQAKRPSRTGASAGGAACRQAHESGIRTSAAGSAQSSCCARLMRKMQAS
eukprot:CAMPEP_0204596716 /NCGR_PEP_ID=MMETSP0661-20131031/53397_1 /ASSEMBLY_ACC=CAM_ASM_000606 /TAXON_ID=109239 /ORGANISM="Alexandrium margalefi, Strain AMGDE01CS-322" /LENGTH=56 /DNA_ID=CAMNT_0051607343 /DNA_START=256 /DNA_END=426 /DNA_ORIENTATION=-